MLGSLWRKQNEKGECSYRRAAESKDDDAVTTVYSRARAMF